MHNSGEIQMVMCTEPERSWWLKQMLRYIMGVNSAKKLKIITCFYKRKKLLKKPGFHCNLIIQVFLKYSSNSDRRIIPLLF